jgi:Flp pilus assembly pilin Flp
MKKLIGKLQIAYMKMNNIDLKSDEGQDLVEYALLIALIAFACTAGMGTLADDINSAFGSLAGKMTQA